MMLHDLHVKIDGNQYKRFRSAIRKLGYATVSAFVRARTREAISRAQELEELEGKKPKPQAAKADVETVKAKFPSDLAQLLSFEVEGQFVVLKPTKFLGSENFAKIAAIVRESDGEYISAGKNSHFRVPLGDKTA